MQPFFINNYKVLPSKNIIIIDGTHFSITPKMMAVLLVISDAKGETVTKSQLLESVWTDVSVSDLVLSRAVTDLRKIFSETAKNSTIIKTIPTIGYCIGSTVKLTTEKSNKTIKAKTYLRFSLVFFLMVIGFILYGMLNQSPHPSQLIPRNLTADNKKESQPRYSQSGNYIAYVKESENSLTSLILYTTHNASFKTLIKVKGIIESPTFSPDDHSIAYYHQTQLKCELVILDLISLNKRTTNCIAKFKFNLDWSTEDWILTGRGDLNNNREGLALINSKDFSVKDIAQPEEDGAKFLFARLSSDSTIIVTTEFQRSSNRWRLGIIDIASGKFTSLLEVHRAINQVVWSKDENIIYYVIASGQHGGLWQYDRRTEEKSLLYSADILDLDYSKKLNQFVQVEIYKDLNIWSFALNPKNKDAKHQRITSASNRENQPAHYKNTELNKIAYISNQTSSNNLWVKDLISGDEVEWTNFKNGMLSDVKWSSDGSTIYFNYSLDSKIQAYFIKMPKTEKLLFEPTKNYRIFSFSKDDRFVYYSSDVTGKWLTHEKDLLTKKSKVILDFTVNNIFPYQGSFYYKVFNHQELYKLSFINGIEHTEEINHLKGAFETWLLVNDSIYLISFNRNKMANLYRYDLKKNALKMLTEVDVSSGVGDSGFSVSSDESILYYTRLQHKKEDLILLDLK